ncbi:MAG: glutamate-5-semialdehyde dehydrogenase [Bdellovibrio sp.]|nr:MAG: glutamate-5-semialdehyde dehydrogenase [Bdellovibrio sp.]
MKLISQLQKCKEAARELRSAKTERKDQVLLRVAELLTLEQASVLKANAKDVKSLPPGTTDAFRDRLLLDEKRLEQMAESLRQVAALPDPVGEEVDRRTLPNGLVLRRRRSPLGVILMIFESRPNVATEAFSLAFKAGNVTLLRGGKESMNSTGALYRLMDQALKEADFSPHTLWGITRPERSLTNQLLKERKWIDIVVPRGGDRLIDFVVKNSEIPIIKNDRGLCHIYVDQAADLEMACKIVVNAKTQRPGVCNAMETLLVHEKVSRDFLPQVHSAMEPFAVEWHLCPESLKILKGRRRLKRAKPADWDTEYLDLKINCKVVRDFDEALSHIERHGSQHSESIVTASEPAARRFQDEVDGAAVYWNASTRFTDGFEFGLGGELGISTQKLHVRGPVGLRELTNLRWIIDGTGQIRG